ncbi:MaoC/PaaZ C-terminal domain-containing protein [Streptomyces sp. NPDC054784]
MLATTLAKGALGSLRKRGPYDGARLPAEPLVLRDVRVDRARLATYADVCGFAPPGTGTGTGAVLPATYPHVLGFPLAMRLLADRAFPFPLLGLVHTGIEVTQHRALRADEGLPEVRVRAEGLAAHRRGSSFDVVTEVRADGTEVWRSRSTYLYRHARAAGTEAEPEAGADTGVEVPGGPLPVRAEWALPGGLGRRYAAASGDRNPIHLHPLTARPFGFRRAIAHGMWLAARCLAATEAEAQAEPGAGTGAGFTGAGRLTLSAEFRSPVLLPATVHYGERNGTFELRAAPEGRLHLTGRVSSGNP